MNIVILDGHTTNPGDLSWDSIKEIGNLTVYDRTPVNEIIPRAKDCEIVTTNKTVLTANIIKQLPITRYIGLLSTGTNAVDLDAAKAHNITVTNVPAYSTASVAQATFALILELVIHTDIHNSSCHAGKWSRQQDFCFTETPLIELAGKTIGIVGYGAIGKAVARIANAFDMNILVHTRTPVQTDNITFTNLDDLLKKSDIVTLHCPLTPQTEKMINASRLSIMKNTAFLINTGRGGLIDENALADALQNKIIAGAGLDVLTQEPPEPDNPLLKLSNCIITPHIAWATYEARKRLINTVTDNLKNFLNNTPINVVS